MKKLIIIAIGFINTLSLFQGCSRPIDDNRTEYGVTPPDGFESFSGSSQASCHYRVWSEMADSVCGFKVRALMTAWIVNTGLRSTTTFSLTHQSCKIFTIDTYEHPLISYEDFNRYYENNHKVHNDTIVSFNYNPVVTEQRTFDMANYGDMPFFFLDVTFDGVEELLIRDGVREFCNRYRVFNIGDKVEELRHKPYNYFVTAANNWMGGIGTTVDYQKRSITISSLDEGSCSDHGTFIKDIYTLDANGAQFTHTRKLIPYDWCD